MTGLEWFLIGIGVKFVADLSVRLSKMTENHIDDMIANALKSAVGGFNLFRKK